MNRDVHIRTNPKVKSQSESIQTENHKKLHLFGTAQTIFLLNCAVWFPVFISKNQIKPQYLT
jgi:hypothetical protein